MSKQKNDFQILIFGGDMVVRKLSNYLGFTSNSQRSGLVYFEFPNDKFAHKKFKKLFPFRLRIYIAQPTLLNTLIAPKQQFKNTDAIIMVHSNHDDALTKDCFEYLEKFSLSAKRLVPILSIAYNDREIPQNKELNSLYFNLEIVRALEVVFGIDVFFLNIREDKNEHLLFPMIYRMLNSYNGIVSREFSSISIERMIKNYRDKIIDLKQNPPDIQNCIKVLGEIEQDNGVRLSRFTLIHQWGLSNRIARKIIDYWEKPVHLDSIKPEDAMLLENEGMKKLNRCRQMNLDPNLINFLTLGSKVDEAKQIMTILHDQRAIKNHTYHIPSIEYKIYDNLQDIIVVSKGRTIYMRSDTSTSDEITLFSGLIQTIEIVRNRYMSEKQKLQNWLKINEVDFLDFGNLHAVIGTGADELKLILRFKEHPQDVYIEKTKAFMKELEEAVEEKITTPVFDLTSVKPIIDKLYYEYYNPFPQKCSFDQIIRVSDDIQKDKIEKLTLLEKLIIDIIESQNGLTIAGILSKASKDSETAKSDLLQLVFDLINEDILV